MPKYFRHATEVYIFLHKLRLTSGEYSDVSFPLPTALVPYELRLYNVYCYYT